MLKRTLAAPPQESGAISGYTSELSRLLRPALPGERADEIVNEAQAHLYDRADALAAEGKLPPAEAESRAVAAFTPAVQFARDMARSAFETTYAKAWRNLGGIIALVLLGGLLALLVLADSFNFLFTFAMPVTRQFFFALSLLVLLCSFQARRAQTRRFAIGAALATVFVFFYTGFYYLDGAPTDEEWTQGSRAGIRRAYHYFRDDRRNRQADIARLTDGMRAFQTERASALPAAFRNNGQGYVVPLPYEAQFWGAFPIIGNETVSTFAQARARWQTDGPRWLAQAKRDVSVSRHYEGPLLTALEQTGWAKTAWWYAAVTAGFGGWLVTLDWLFAKLGRALFAKRRARRVKRA